MMSDVVDFLVLVDVELCDVDVQDVVDAVDVVMDVLLLDEDVEVSH